MLDPKSEESFKEQTQFDLNFSQSMTVRTPRPVSDDSPTGSTRALSRKTSRPVPPGSSRAPPLRRPWRRWWRRSKVRRRRSGGRKATSGLNKNQWANNGARTCPSCRATGRERRSSAAGGRCRSRPRIKRLIVASSQSVKCKTAFQIIDLPC